MIEELSKLLTLRASRAAKSGVREVIARSAGLIVAALLFVSAFLFALLALFHTFAESHGPVVTAVVMSLCLLVLSVIAWLVAERRAGHEKRRRQEEAEALQQSIQTAMSLVGKLGSDDGTDKSKLILPLAGLIVGFLISSRGSGSD